MSVTDASAPSNGESTGKSLVVVNEATASSASPSAVGSAPDFAGEVRRWVMPAAFLVLAAGAGWFAGAQSSMAVSAGHRVAIESSLASDLKGASADLALLAARLKSLEDAKSDPALKPAIEILARRIDEIARTQTAAMTQTSSRFERTDRELGARLDRLIDRMERMEKQVSASAPVGSISKAVAASSPATTSIARTAPDAAEKADEGEVKSIRSYVLRDVFRGGALVESRHGLMEVFPGVVLPGAGRVRSVERRDGRWVVITTAGIIESRR